MEASVPPNHIVPPSSAAHPDLDWSQVRETILMLNLAVAQIELALRDSNGSVDVLTDSFTGMYGNLMALVEAAGALPDSPVKAAIEESGASVSRQMSQAIVAFQFYDRMSQRLTHVCRGLDELGDIVSKPERLYSPFAWHALQQKIRAKYTMEEERAMFDEVVRTGDVQAALQHYARDRQDRAGGASDVELF